MKRLIPFLLILLILAGCGSKINVEHLENMIGKEPEAKQKCAEHGQDFAAITTLDMETYKTICVQTSPFKIIEYTLS